MITLTEDQLNAKDFLLKSLQNHKIGLLTGYAGTGKTTLLKDLVATLGKTGEEITIATPTHKAAAVVRKMGVKADVMTIHKAFGIAVSQGFNGKSRQSPATKRVNGIVIVDEASMLDENLLNSILINSKKNLFIGDIAQLPPVSNEGETKLSPVFEQIAQTVNLTKVMRQAADNPIIALATWIRQKIESGQTVGQSELLQVAQQIDPNQTKIGIDSVHNIPNLVADAIKNGLDCRMIGYTNEATTRTAHRIKVALTGHPDYFSAGDPIYFNSPQLAWSSSKKKFELKIDNNEESFILSAEPPTIDDETGLLCQIVNLNQHGIFKVPCNIQAYRTLKKRLGEEYDALKLKLKFGANMDIISDLRDKNQNLTKYLTNNFADLRINHAMTIHKSQGSTFDAVVLDLRDIFKMREHLLRGLYVAVTRPSQYLILCN